MSVTSRPLRSTDHPPRTVGDLAIPLAGLAIGALLWPIGARYSIDGLFWLANAVLEFLRVPLQLPTPPEWGWYCVLAPLPYICSSVEWKPPIYRHDRRWHAAPANVVVTWLCIAGYDFGTTYLGASTPTPKEAGITVEIAASVALTAILALALTFGPEWLMRTSWRQMRQALER